MNAKIALFSELSKFLGDKTSVCSDFLSLLDRFQLGRSLSNLKMEKEKGAKSIELFQYLLISHPALYHTLWQKLKVRSDDYHRYESGFHPNV